MEPHIRQGQIATLNPVGGGIGKLLFRSGNTQEAKQVLAIAAQEYPESNDVSDILQAINESSSTPKDESPHKRPAGIPIAVLTGIAIATLFFLFGRISVDRSQESVAGQLSAASLTTEKSSNPTPSVHPEQKQLTVATSDDGNANRQPTTTPIPSTDTTDKKNTSNPPVIVVAKPETSPTKEDIKSPEVVTNSQALKDISAKLKDTDGLRVEYADGVVRATPLEGVFPLGSTDPDNQGEALLHAIADTINEFKEPVKVHIIGFTDAALPQKKARWTDNWQLALYRAASTVALMKNGNNQHEWLASFRDVDQSPFPNDSDNNRRRNRTVIIEILPKNE